MAAGSYRARPPLFLVTFFLGTRNYPDFIITAPYLIAIEYKKSLNASLVKQLIGQSIVHTLSDELDFVYCLFHDESKGKKIKNSVGNNAESAIINRMRDDFNLYLRFI